MCSIGSTFRAGTERRISPSRPYGGCITTAKAFPRLVNAVCDKALLAGYVQQSEKIDFRMVGQAVRELEGNINA